MQLISQNKIQSISSVNIRRESENFYGIVKVNYWVDRVKFQEHFQLLKEMMIEYVHFTNFAYFLKSFDDFKKLVAKRNILNCRGFKMQCIGSARG